MKEFNISITLQECEYAELSDADKKLVDKAKEATYRSYSPYSKFSVGACLSLVNGIDIVGCNQENAAYPVGLCAERVAIYSAQAQYPGVAIDTLAIAARNTEGQFVAEPISPCGSCRQVILEQEYRLHRPIKIILVGENRIYVASKIEDLLPLTFVETDMNA